MCMLSAPSTSPPSLTASQIADLRLAASKLTGPTRRAGLVEEWYPARRAPVREGAAVRDLLQPGGMPGRDLLPGWRLRLGRLRIRYAQRGRPVVGRSHAGRATGDDARHHAGGAATGRNPN